MSFPKLKEAIAKLNALRDELAAVFAEAGPDYDMDLVNSLTGDSADKVEWIRAKNAEIDAQKKIVEDLREVEKAAEFAASHPEAGESSDDPAPKTGPVLSLGQRFVESQAFKGFQGGTGPQATLEMDIRNTLFQTSAGWAPESTRTGILSEFPTRPAPHVVDFVPSLPTGQAAIKYMKETTFTNAAAEAAEGGTFAEAALALTETSQTVEKIAVFLPVTDEQLEDEQAVSGYIDQRLVFMIRQRLDLQILQGTGVTPLLLGTENVTGIQTQALGVDPIPDAIYKLFRQIRDDGFAEPSVVFITPAKWESVRLLRTADGIYIWGAPTETGPEMIWGVPVVQTTAAPATKAIAGDYLNHSNIYVRRGVDVQVSNSHSTYFVDGKQAIRADLRVAMVHYRVKGFGEVTGL